MSKSTEAPTAVKAPEVRAYLITLGVTEGYGSRGRIALPQRVAFVVANPRRAREHASVVGLALGSKAGRLSASDAEAVALTVGG